MPNTGEKPGKVHILVIAVGFYLYILYFNKYKSDF